MSNSYVQGSFAATGASDHVGIGPLYYRLNCSVFSSGPIVYFFGYEGLFKTQRHPLLILSGFGSATVDVQYSTAPDDAASWVNVPNESYTADDSRRLS